MDKSDKSRSGTDETNSTTITVKRRGRRKQSEDTASGMNAAAQAHPSEVSAEPVSDEAAPKRGRKKAVASETVTPEGVVVKVKSTRGRKQRQAVVQEAEQASDKGNGSATVVTTDAAQLAAIDTSGYVLPAVKVPGRRGRKPKDFQPENEEVAALNAVERAEMKAADKARAKDRMAKE